MTGSVILKCKFFYQKGVVHQDGWSLITVVYQERLHCTVFNLTLSANHGRVVRWHTTGSFFCMGLCGNILGSLSIDYGNQDKKYSLDLNYVTTHCSKS